MPELVHVDVLLARAPLPTKRLLFRSLKKTVREVLPMVNPEDRVGVIGWWKEMFHNVWHDLDAA